MKGIKKDNIEKFVFIFIIIVGLGYSYAKFLFLPEWTAIQSLTSQLHTQENNYQELLTYQRNQSGLQQEIKTLESKVSQLNTQIPKQLDEPQLMVGLYTLAKQHSAYPQSIAFAQPQTKGTYQELAMSFSCLGKPADILALIHDLQFGKSQRLTISSVNLTVQQGTMLAELKLTADASIGIARDTTLKPAFMNAPLGVDSPVKLFQ